MVTYWINAWKIETQQFHLGGMWSIKYIIMDEKNSKEAMFKALFLTFVRCLFLCISAGIPYEMSKGHVHIARKGQV